MVAGWRTATTNLVLRSVADDRSAPVVADIVVPRDAWAVVNSHGTITPNPEIDGHADQWAWVFAHLLLHLGLAHLDRDRLAEADALLPNDTIDPVYAAACCVAVNRLSDVIRVGQPLVWMPELPPGDELELTRQWRAEGVPPQLRRCGTGGQGPCFHYAPPAPHYAAPAPSWTDRFARGLTDAASAAMEQAAEGQSRVVRKRALREWDRALVWFVSSYPLLGAVAAGLTIVDDPEIARAWDIAIAAVSAEHGEVYVNPHVQLSPEEWRFVLAHEMLHAALRHDRRADGRDPYLWNVACDFVINGWLVAMSVGQLPEGSLYDPRLAGLSAESVYDTLSIDLRRARRLRTLGGRSAGDVLGDWLSRPEADHRRQSRRAASAPLPWERNDRGKSVDLDAFYRRALMSGLEYHRKTGRGLVAAGLEQEIRALEHPPLPWDAQLARWFDEHVRAPEARRSYARASRRQSATPEIPRPGVLHPQEPVPRATFGVVLDTSGSMNAQLLGKALGAVASYATARDVPAVRVVFCDAVAYDAGYLATADIAGRVTVRGRGGTVLQPGVTLLQDAADFPPDAPILVITDAYCDVVRIRREHAFLVPEGARLPFTPRGPVFRVR
jgi:predicted metal-dependent peptidase